VVDSAEVPESQANVIELSINGEPLSVDPPVTVAQLLERQGLAGKRLAVERNGEIVPRSRHADTLLAPGDRLEIVVAVGGG
jgi:sulfur carrier protein